MRRGVEEGRRYRVVRKAARMGGRRDVIRASVALVFGEGVGGGFVGGVEGVVVLVVVPEVEDEDCLCRATYAGRAEAGMGVGVGVGEAEAEVGVGVDDGAGGRRNGRDPVGEAWFVEGRVRCGMEFIRRYVCTASAC